MTRRLPIRVLLLVLASALFAGCGYLSIRESSEKAPDAGRRDAQPAAAATDDLPFGNPSNAGSGDVDNYLVVHERFALSYNDDRGTPNWIAWWTRAADLGPRRERSQFRRDDSLPAKLRKIDYYDYSGSGYDRGHMVPAADRFASERLMSDTFLMTNIVPQTPDLNQFPWNELESYARSLARRGFDVYSIAGVYGEARRLRGRVVVPTNCWKVIALVSRGRRVINTTSRVFAVDMPNIDGLEKRSWQDFRTTVRDIESRTGLDLFSALPRDVQDSIETRRETGFR